MKLSLKWLNEYVDVEEFFENPQSLGDMLTRAGLELEGIESHRDNYKNIVIGKIVEKAKHPDADKLSLCKVDVGDKVVPIVCGAKNHNQGDYVVAALPGAVLPGDFKIKKSKIRGEESCGMLCSEKELGLSDESAGIITLKKATAGQSFVDHYELNDVVFDLSVTPNRADCLSHVGLAREVSCLLGRPLKLNEPQFKTSKESTKKIVTLSLEDSGNCPRYAGRVIRGVKVGASPLWLQKKLEAVDINSINNIVDITNFVMLELGQPLHAFDLKQLGGPKVVISKSKHQEAFKTLDGTELKLTGDELVIRDSQGPIALAGVIGGVNSGVTDETQDLFLESAHFTQKTVRQTARRFGIETDSSYRFSRGTDPEGVVFAMNRACELIQTLAGGDVAEDFYDEYPKPFKKQTILVNKAFIQSKLGYEVDESEFEDWMSRLGCEVSGSAKQWKVLVPTYRWDLNESVDLVEEYARLHGYENIPEYLPEVSTEPIVKDTSFELERHVESILTTQGYMQAMNYHFINYKEQVDFLKATEPLKAVGLKTTSTPVRVKNPLNEELDSMRLSLLPGLTRNLTHNVRHGNEFGRLYEIGACFSFGADKEYQQHYNLAFMCWGQKESLWEKPASRPVVYDLKSSIENMMTQLNIKNFEWRGFDAAPDFVHPGQCSGLFCEGQLIGFIGSMHPSRLKTLKIKEDVAVAELDWERLLRRQPRVSSFAPLSKFPSVERDLAFVMPQGLASVAVTKEIKKAAGALLEDVRAFDVYRGEHIGEDEKCISFKLRYQDKKGTLNDGQIKKLQQDVINSVTTQLSVRIR